MSSRRAVIGGVLLTACVVLAAGCGSPSRAGQSTTDDDSQTTTETPTPPEQDCSVSDLVSGLAFLTKITGPLEDVNSLTDRPGWSTAEAGTSETLWSTSNGDLLEASTHPNGLTDVTSMLIYGEQSTIDDFERIVGDGSGSGVGHLLVGVSGLEALPGPRLLAVFDSATGAIEAPNGCSERYTQGLARVTDLTGQPPRDALTALTDEVQTRVAGADAGPLQSAAEGFAPAPTDTMTADEAWYATPAEQRTLVFNEVPEEIKPRLKLVAVVVEVDPALGDGELYLRCELGVGWASNLSATGPASPVSVCRESPMNVYLDGRSIGQIAPEDLSDVDGTRLLISSSPDGPVFSLEQLADGDLEQILGVTSEQLEELRKQYADEA